VGQLLPQHEGEEILAPVERLAVEHDVARLVGDGRGRRVGLE
jgi:hypothetical protein